MLIYFIIYHDINVKNRNFHDLRSSNKIKRESIKLSIYPPRDDKKYREFAFGSIIPDSILTVMPQEIIVQL